MNLDSFTGPGSTPSRKRFWDKVTALVNASQKRAGRHVSVEEYIAKGTLISVPGDASGLRRPSTSTGACCFDDETCDDLTEAACNDAGGNWQGLGTTCADDPNPCLGACLCSGFNALDGSCRSFLTRTQVLTAHYETFFSEESFCTSDETFTITDSIDPDTCETTNDCTGSYTLTTAGGTLSGDPCDSWPGGCGFCQGECYEFSPVTLSLGCDSTDCSCSDTTLTCSQSLSGDCETNPGSCTFEYTLTLSDECIPATGACCDYDSLTCSVTTQCECDCDACSYLGDDTVCDDCGF